MTANLDNIHEIYNIFIQKNRMHADIITLFRRFQLSRTLSRLKMEKQQGVSASLLIVLLCLFRMCHESIGSFYSHKFHGLFESGKNPAMSNIPKAIYWAVVTITTVGYGDISPVTPMGQFISMIVMLLGYSIIAVPTGIVVGETINEYKHKRPNENQNQNENQNEGEVVVPEEFNEYEDNAVQRTESGGEAAPRFCTHCGHTETDPDAKFCRYCGTMLSKSQPSGWINDFFSGE